MTDLATRHDTDEPSTGSVPIAPSDETAVLDQPAQWAPSEPAPRKKRRLWLWIGIPAAVVVGGAAAASTLLIAPGTSVAGVPVGFMTAGAATDAIGQRLAETSIALGDGATVTGADLGATVDAGALATAAFDQRPMWNVTQWFGDAIPGPVTLDPTKAAAALQSALPAAFTDATPAQVSFDGAGYTVTPAVDGTGIDLSALSAQLSDAFAAGTTAVTFEPTVAAVASPATTANAQSTADKLNAMLANVGFYVGEERTVPVDAATAASWLSVTANDAGEFVIAADAAKIQPVVDTLAGVVNQDPVNGTVITNSSGAVLETITQGQDGRVLGDTSAVADDFAAQLATGDGAFALPVEVTPAAIATKHRTIEVDLSAQRVYLKENGQLVDSWSVSTGRPGASVTRTGNYTINAHVRSQTMSGTVLDDPNGRKYSLDNVQWAMYFNGDQAFHGVYWHQDYLRGVPNSNGCVGMSNARAEQLYMFAANGTEVSIYGTTPSR